MKKMFQYLIEGKEMVLVTVVASSGATPRGAGARMIVTEEGRIWGTIGGGAVEYRSEQMAKQVLKDKNSFGHDFSLTKDDVQNLGMICGGAVQVFFHYIPRNDEKHMELAKIGLSLYEQGKDLWLLSDMSKGGALGLYSKETGFMDVEESEWILPYLKRHPKLVKENDREIYVEQIQTSGRVYIFGCGHVAQELVPVLEHVGFRCIAMDDRLEFANETLFPKAEKVMLVDFQKIADYVEITENDYVCVMTRGHAYDTIVQAQVLKTPACYIGVIGSKAKKADTDRITSPVGLTIKSETPAEIAISIAGQMILHRAERNKK